jgi:hypothetical protein
MEAEKLVVFPKEFREAFLEALRSGRYVQGSGALAKQVVGHPIEWCCLGVACHVAGIPVDKLFHMEYPHEINIREGWRAVDTSSIPEALMTEDIDDYPMQLAGLNDNGKSFEEIADYIEQTSIGV